MEVIIVTGDKYPCEDAGAIRQHALAKILIQLGYKVTVIGYGKPTNGRFYEYEGVNYTSFRPKGTNVIVKAISRLLFGSKALSLIKSKRKDVKVILVVDVLPLSYVRIANYARKNHIKIVHDSVEWYSPEEFTNGKNNIDYRIKELVNTKIIKGDWRVIAISKYLENHFIERCKKTIRIPVIMDMETINCRTETSLREKKVFSYVGGPGKKDYLKELIGGFLLLDDKYLAQIEFHVIGANKEELVQVCGIDERQLQLCEKFLTAHGRLPHEEAINWVIQSDYTMLLRDETLRYAKAGFPTKVVESLSFGTPVVCNVSSDLGDYLYNKYNSILIKGHNVEDVKNAIMEAISVDEEIYLGMRKNARVTAEKFFDYKLYCEQVKELLDQ